MAFWKLDFEPFSHQTSDEDGRKSAVPVHYAGLLFLSAPIETDRPQSSSIFFHFVSRETFCHRRIISGHLKKDYEVLSHGYL